MFFLILSLMWHDRCISVTAEHFSLSALCHLPCILLERSPCTFTSVSHFKSRSKCKIFITVHPEYNLPDNHIYWFLYYSQEVGGGVACRFKCKWHYSLKSLLNVKWITFLWFCVQNIFPHITFILIPTVNVTILKGLVYMSCVSVIAYLTFY